MNYYIIFSLKKNVTKGIYNNLEKAKTNLPSTEECISQQIIIKEMENQGLFNSKIVWNFANL